MSGNRLRSAFALDLSGNVERLHKHRVCKPQSGCTYLLERRERVGYQAKARAIQDDSKRSHRSHPERFAATHRGAIVKDCEATRVQCVRDDSCLARPSNRSGLQWGTIRNLLMAWVLTLPASIGLSALLFWAFSQLN
jgi:hypothetical protein